jgi:hypothetical protein
MVDENELDHILEQLADMRRERDDAIRDLYLVSDMIGILNLEDCDFELVNKIRKKWSGRLQ